MTERTEPRETICAVAQDIMPLMLDNVCSSESRSFVEEHVQNCEGCREALALMQAEDRQTPSPEEATENRACLDILYIDRTGAESRRTVEPHLLVFKQNIWYIYAWCRKREDFRLFRVGRIRSARRTGETFEKRPFDRDSLPLKFNFAQTELVDLKLSVQKRALPDLEEWLGVDNIRTDADGNLTASAVLPGGDVLLSKILSFGSDVTVLAPQSVADEVKARAKEIAARYE